MKKKLTGPRKKPRPIEQLLPAVQRMGEARGNVLYEIAFRNAGVGLVWIEAARVKTKQTWKKISVGKKSFTLPDIECSQQRIKEGMVVYQYHPTLRKAIVEEMKRLIKLPKTYGAVGTGIHSLDEKNTLKPTKR